MKKSDLISGYNTLANCKYSKDMSALALTHIKLEGVFEKFQSDREKLAKKIGGKRLEEFQEILQDAQMGKEVKLDLFKEAKAFEDSLVKAVQSLLNEDVKIELPKLEIEVLFKENELTAKQTADLYKLFKVEGK